MKKLKVYWMGKRLKDIYPYATKGEVIKFRIRKFFRKLFKLLILSVIVFISCLIAVNYFPVETEVEKFVQVEGDYPVLKRIAICESENRHFALNGQVVVNGNNNGSVDIGKYQINMRIWGKVATEMNLDLTKEKDNEIFAKYLYKNFGTEPWIYTKKCWNK